MAASKRPPAHASWLPRGGSGANLFAWVIVALAFVLRLYRLADRNIWWDEGWTIWLGRMDPVAIALRTAVDAHPPLHYWLMHYWGRLAGTDVFVGRLLSVFFGTLSLAVMYRLGAQAGGVRLGLLAAFLLALARFHVWWSQDIKNYTLAGFFGLAGAWFVLRLFQAHGRSTRPRWPLWVGYAASSLLAVYSHYLAWLLFLAHNVFAAIVLLARWRRAEHPWRGLASWAAAQVAIVGLFAPWLALHLNNATTWTAAPPVEPGFFLRLTGTLFALGVTRNLEAQSFAVAFLLGLAALGAGLALRRSPAARSRQAALLALLIVCLPPVVLYGLSFTPAAFFAPQLQPRYLLIFLPGFSLLLAMGLRALVWRWRPVGLTALVIAAALMAGSLSEYYRGRRLRDDYFTLANVINAFAEPGDGLLLHTDQEWPVLLYYLRNPLPWDGVLAGEALSPSMAAAMADKISARFRRVWLVTIPDALARDPQRLMAAELARRLAVQYDHTFGDKRLTLYAQAPELAQAVPAETFAVQHHHPEGFSPGLTLLGYDLPVDEPRAGDDVRLVTYWNAAQAVTVRVELRDPAGITRAAETAPVPPGERVRVQTDVQVPADAPAEQTLVVIVPGELPEALAQIEAEPVALPAPEAGEIANPVDYTLGAAVHLVGHTLPQSPLVPGQAYPLTLFWRSAGSIEQDYKVFVHLVGGEFNPDLGNPLWGQVDRFPLDGAVPMPAWEPGAVIADHYLLPVDPDAPPGEYRLVVGMYDALSGARLPVYAGAGVLAGDEILINMVEVAPAP